MRRDLPLTPWPRLRQTWWVYGLAAALLALYCTGLLVRVRCAVLGHCGGSGRFFDLDAVGGLPRLATTALFAVTAVLAWRASRRQTGRGGTWWISVAVICVVLALAKLSSLHSLAKQSAAVLTLVVGVVGAAVILGALAVTGRRWGVAATVPVVVALAGYAAASLGLDAITSLVAAVQSQAGALTDAAATFVEELGEALTALVLLVTVRWQESAAHRRVYSADGLRPRQSVRQQ